MLTTLLKFCSFHTVDKRLDEDESIEFDLPGDRITPTIWIGTVPSHLRQITDNIPVFNQYHLYIPDFFGRMNEVYVEMIDSHYREVFDEHIIECTVGARDASNPSYQFNWNLHGLFNPDAGVENNMVAWLKQSWGMENVDFTLNEQSLTVGFTMIFPPRVAEKCPIIGDMREVITNQFRKEFFILSNCRWIILEETQYDHMYTLLVEIINCRGLLVCGFALFFSSLHILMHNQVVLKNLYALIRETPFLVGDEIDYSVFLPTVVKGTIADAKEASRAAHLKLLGVSSGKRFRSVNFIPSETFFPEEDDEAFDMFQHSVCL